MYHIDVRISPPCDQGLKFRWSFQQDQGNPSYPIWSIYALPHTRYRARELPKEYHLHRTASALCGHHPNWCNSIDIDGIPKTNKAGWQVYLSAWNTVWRYLLEKAQGGGRDQECQTRRSSESLSTSQKHGKHQSKSLKRWHWRCRQLNQWSERAW